MTSVGARTHLSTRGDSNAQGRYAAHTPLATDSRHPGGGRSGRHGRRQHRPDCPPGGCFQRHHQPLLPGQERLAGSDHAAPAQRLEQGRTRTPRGALRRQSEGAPASDRRRQLRRQPGQWSGDEDLAGVLGDQHAPAGTASIAAGQRPSPVFEPVLPVPPPALGGRRPRRGTRPGGPDRRPVVAWRADRRRLRYRRGPEHRLRLPRPAVGKTVGGRDENPRGAALRLRYR